VESFRSRRRQMERLQRRQHHPRPGDEPEEYNDDEYGNTHRQDRKDDGEEELGGMGKKHTPSKFSSSSSSSHDYDIERRQRMARLREELEMEDKEMTSLERQQQDNDGTNVNHEPYHTVRPQEEIVEVNPEELEGLDEDEQMRKLMGIDGFGSTKGQKVEDNHNSSARGVATKNKARKYRQYMNRKNGFNRPLEKMN